MRRVSRVLYSLIYTVALALYLPLALFNALTGRKRTALRRRLTRPRTVARRDSNRSRIWIQAVSVGELNAVKPLAQLLRDEGVDLFLTTTTETSQQLARSSLEIPVGHFPLDWTWLCRRHLEAVKPDLILLVESELWPGFLSAAADLHIPVVVVNGRISDRSFRRYHRFRGLVAPLLSRIEHFCMQSKQDKERILSLGIEESRVNWVGNLKYDVLRPAAETEQTVRDQVCRLLKNSEDDLLWLCGSTRDGEEAILIAIYGRLLDQFPSLRLVLAPRHPHRGPEICASLTQAGIDFVARSQPDFFERQASCHALLLDSIGELSALYEVADIVFVGGSLIAHGGQNIIEPAAYAKPILYGPHMENFREISDTFLRAYGAIQVQDGRELEAKMAELLPDSHARQWLGRNARSVIKANQGSVGRTREIVMRFLE